MCVAPGEVKRSPGLRQKRIPSPVGALLIEVEPMDIITRQCGEAIAQLIAHLQPNDFIDDEEQRLAKEFNALPLGLSLWSYGFLTPDGELVETDWEPNEILRTRDTQQLICAIAIAARRFPTLERFVPSRPVDSTVCKFCNGTKVWGERVADGKPAICVGCAGLGWTYAASES